MEYDWFKIKFLESTTNLKVQLKKSVGREPSSTVASEITSCLQQGRLFFDAAKSSPLEIRPLQLFYGITGFAKAVALARNLQSIDTLVKSHGIKDNSGNAKRIEDLKILIGNKGTFQHFNDAICELSLIRYYGYMSAPCSIKLATDKASKFKDMTLSIKDILARIPKLEGLYSRTFSEPSKVCSISLHMMQQPNYFSLRIDDPDLFDNRESLQLIIKKWRDQFPFLEKWTLHEAQHGWGNSILTFGNYSVAPDSEFDSLIESDLRFYRAGVGYVEATLEQVLQPLAGGLTNRHPSILQSYNGVYFSEYSLQYLGMYLLSTLVRYRPQIWSSSIMHTSNSVALADDKMLALIEQFMEVTMHDFADMAVEAISYCH